MFHVKQWVAYILYGTNGIVSYMKYWIACTINGRIVILFHVKQ